MATNIQDLALEDTLDKIQFPFSAFFPVGKQIYDSLTLRKEEVEFKA